jgi:cytochrome P450
VSVTTPRRTPTISGLRVVASTVRGGLAVDGPLVTSVRGSDIVRFSFAGRTTFVLGHPGYVDHVLHEAVDRYEKSVEYELLRSVVGLSLFTDEGESWRRHRRLLTPLFSKRHVRELCELMLIPIESFIQRLSATGGEQDRIEVDVTRGMTELTLDVVGSALFGRGMADLARRLAPLVTDGLRAAELTARMMMIAAPPRPLFRAWATFVQNAPLLPPPLHRIQAVMRTVDRTVWEVVRERQANPGSSGDLLGLLLSVRDERGEPLPLRRVRDEATTFILAGHETTANAMAWMWYLLALNPAARERLLDEVDAVLGGRPPQADDVNRLTWTAACVQEAMRIFPPAWSVPRTAIADDVIDGHRIPRGASVLIPIYTIHHDPRFWPDPERFDPARFLPENVHGRHRSAYLPFGGGRRICIGSSFALMEATLIAAMISQRFVFDLVAGHPVEPEATLTLRPRKGLRMIAVRRQADADQLARNALGKRSSTNLNGERPGVSFHV